MAITRSIGSFGNRITAAGEYVVEVIRTESGKSKKGKPMLTVTFSTSDEKEIRAWFVKELPFHMSSLVNLKIACGLKPEVSADELVGKSCGIAVDQKEPDEQGRIFFHVTGYGKVSDVENAPVVKQNGFETTNDDSAPF